MFSTPQWSYTISASILRHKYNKVSKKDLRNCTDILWLKFDYG